IRAVGYELIGASAVAVGARKQAEFDLTLRKTDELAKQLSNAEWLASMPGSPEQKRGLIECMSCHTLERVVRSRYNGEQMFGALKRMATYANNSTVVRVQPRAVERKY